MELRGRGLGGLMNIIRLLLDCLRELLRLRSIYLDSQLSAINGTKVGLAPAWLDNSIYETDVEAFIAAVRTPEGQRLTKRFLELSDGETRNAFELGIPESLVQLQM